MKKRLRKRKKIRGGRAVFRCITDPAGVTYWQGPDRDIFAAFKREMLRTLRERLPGEIWAKIEEEPTP